MTQEEKEPLIKNLDENLIKVEDNKEPGIINLNDCAKGVIVYQESKWIKVTDRLPEKEDHYHVTAKNVEYFEKGKVGIVFFSTDPDDIDMWEWNYSHWQPIILPNPPKE